MKPGDRVLCDDGRYGTISRLGTLGAIPVFFDDGDHRRVALARIKLVDVVTRLADVARPPTQHPRRLQKHLDEYTHGRTDP